MTRFIRWFSDWGFPIAVGLLLGFIIDQLSRIFVAVVIG